MAVVDRVEADQRGEQADVGDGDGVADEVAAGGQALLEAVQRRPQLVVGLLVGLLVGGEPAAVHTVVHRGVDPRVEFVDLVAVLVGVQVGRALAVEGRPLGDEVEVELLVRVCHHGLGGQVDQRRHRDAARIVRDAVEVGLLQAVQAGDGIPLVRVEVEDPGVDVVRGAGQAQGDGVLEAHEAADDDAPAGPRAGSGGHEPVTAGLDRPSHLADLLADRVRTRGHVRHHAIVDVRRVADELAVGRGVLCGGEVGRGRHAGLPGLSQFIDASPIIPPAYE